MKPNLAFIFFISFLLALTPGSNAAWPPVSQQLGRRTDERHTSEFRYIITSNNVAEYRHPERYIHVLLDESAFSEGTLIRLFSLISKRFPEPERLWVYVATSLWQMSPPEEDDIG